MMDVSGVCVCDWLGRFVAERGDRAQLTHIDNIHRSYDLKPMPRIAPTHRQKRTFPSSPEKPLPAVSAVPR